MIVEPALVIALLSCETEAFLSEAPEARFPVGRILLAIDPGPSIADDQSCSAQMIAEVVLYRRGCFIRKRAANTNESNATLIIDHVQDILLQRRAKPDDAVMFKAAINVNGDLDLTALLANQLFHAVPVRVVQI